MMRYDSFTYLWPPRPESAVLPTLTPIYENKGFVAQVKREGTCSVIAVSPTGVLTAMNRHNEPHRAWSSTPASSAAFQGLPGDGWYVFVAELLHSKVAGGPRDTNYIFDILVADGEYLVGHTFEERQAILAEIFPTTLEDAPYHRVITPNTWVAKNFTTGFMALFNGLSSALDEGIVMKNPKAKLQMCSRQSANNDWQVKSRRRKKNSSA